MVEVTSSNVSNLRDSYSKKFIFRNIERDERQKGYKTIDGTWTGLGQIPGYKESIYVRSYIRRLEKEVAF